MKKLLFLIFLCPLLSIGQTLTTAQLTTRLLIAEANIDAINKKLSGIYTTLGSYKEQLVAYNDRLKALESVPKDSIKVVEGLTLNNKSIGLDTVYTDKRYMASILQLAIYFLELDKKTSVLTTTIDSVKASTVLTFNGIPIGKELNFLDKQFANKTTEAKLEALKLALKNL